MTHGWKPKLAALALATALVAPAPAFAQTAATNAPSQNVMSVSLELLRNAEVVGSDREEIGEIQELVRSGAEVDPVDAGADPVDAGEGAVQDTAEMDPVDAGEGQGIYAVVNVDNGWFEEDRQIVVPVGRFTVLEDDTVMLPDVAEDTIGTEFEEYEEADWGAVDYTAYSTLGDAYEGYGYAR